MGKILYFNIQNHGLPEYNKHVSGPFMAAHVKENAEVALTLNSVLWSATINDNETILVQMYLYITPLKDPTARRKMV